jgi:transcriptional regulator with XRE-family HTH domain
MGEVVKRFRESAELTGEELGAKIGMSKQNIWWIEKGKNKMRVESMMRFCRATRCPIETLIIAYSQDCREHLRRKIREINIGELP